MAEVVVTEEEVEVDMEVAAAVDMGGDKVMPLLLWYVVLHRTSINCI